MSIGFRCLGCQGDIGVVMENQMEKKLENDMETGIIGFIGVY